MTVNWRTRIVAHHNEWYANENGLDLTIREVFGEEAPYLTYDYEALRENVSQYTQHCGTTGSLSVAKRELEKAVRSYQLSL
jgi:hypothetical protein